MDHSRGVSIGVSVLRKYGCALRMKKERAYGLSILILTFIAYTSFHLSRRPLSVVKTALNKNCSFYVPPPYVIVTNATKESWCSWKPFDGKNANELLGILDSCFLFSYAIFMFTSGMLAERLDLRYFLSLGMLFTGLFTYLAGLAHTLNIHSFFYFAIIQILAGAAQTTGWPSVVTCVGNWYGKTRRGFIFGVWNAHLYVGNILGAYIAAEYVKTNWGYSFMIPGLIVGLGGFLIFLFLVPYPSDVECDEPNHHSGVTNSGMDISSTGSAISMTPSEKSVDIIKKEDTYLLKIPVGPNKDQNKSEAITFIDALKIPGVVDFSLCLFFAKLVSYTFLFWLPKYISNSMSVDSQDSAYLSIPFDVGGIIGGVLAGIISDQTGASAITCVSFLGLAVPVMFLYNAFGSTSMASNVILQLVCGLLVNGPYALITTAVSAELGTHSLLGGNSRALATVTAIIDGTGSIGAAVGPLLAGAISSSSWNDVFYMMMASDFLALLTLARIAIKEGARIRNKMGQYNLR